jgi:uncharacterized membrane protein YkvA (DUF1232 family)
MFSKIKIETPKDKRMAVIGLVCLVYLLNPTFGLFELLPDNLPIIGNLDEALAVAGLLNVCRYFGYDFLSWFSPKQK